MAFTSSQNIALALLRIGFSGLMLTHGTDKFLNLLKGNFQFADPIGLGETTTLVLAVLAEFVCPLFLIVGYKTRWATVLPILAMLVAACVVHLHDPMTNKEHPLLYLNGFLVIAVFGAGKYSVDGRKG